MAKVTWTDDAVRHLIEIAAYVRQFDPIAADDTARRLQQAGESLSSFPNRGRPAGGGRRELVTVPRYIIRYKVVAEQVTILGVRHGARRRGAD